MKDAVIVQRLRDRLESIRAELSDLKKTCTGVSLRSLSLNDQCDLLEDLLDVPRSHPRATRADR